MVTQHMQYRSVQEKGGGGKAHYKIYNVLNRPVRNKIFKKLNEKLYKQIIMVSIIQFVYAVHFQAY